MGSIRGLIRALGVLVVAVAMSGLMGACGGAKSGGSTTSASSGKDPAGSGLKVVEVSGPLADPFFAAWKKGCEAAAASLGATCQYLAPENFNNITADLNRLMQIAMAEKPAAIAVGDFVPPVTGPLIKQAIGKGIPVVVVNSGRATWQSYGALTFIGEDPTDMGAQAGQLETKAGVKHGLCVNQQPENPVLGQRCAGYIAALQAAGGSGKTLSIPPSESTNPTAIQQAIAGGLSADSKIDGVFTLGTDEADAALRAIGSRPIKVGTTDLSVNVLNEVKSGKLLFAIDQQPYLQGYYSVLVGVQNALYGVHPVGAITTGPLVVIQSNVDTVLSAQQKYAVRGAS